MFNEPPTWRLFYKQQSPNNTKIVILITNNSNIIPIKLYYIFTIGFTSFLFMSHAVETQRSKAFLFHEYTKIRNPSYENHGVITLLNSTRSIFRWHWIYTSVEFELAATTRNWYHGLFNYYGTPAGNTAILYIDSRKSNNINKFKQQTPQMWKNCIIKGKLLILVIEYHL